MEIISVLVVFETTREAVFGLIMTYKNCTNNKLVREVKWLKDYVISMKLPIGEYQGSCPFFGRYFWSILYFIDRWRTYSLNVRVHQARIETKRQTLTCVIVL